MTSTSDGIADLSDDLLSSSMYISHVEMVDWILYHFNYLVYIKLDFNEL